MSAFSPKQIRALRRKLDRSHVHSRSHEGREFDYIEGWFGIAEANAIFGFDGWDRQTLHIERLFERNRGELTSCSYLARVRISVRAADLIIVREGMGCGSASAKSPADAHERAIKTAETDATKRALATFGNRFGLCLYDKDQAGVSGARPTWTLYDPTGRTFADTRSPEAFCGALRQVIEKAPRAEVAAWRDKNADALMRLRQLDELRSASGAHYADILHQLIRARMNVTDPGPERVAGGSSPSEESGSGPPPAPALAPSRIAPSERIDKSALAIGSERRFRDKDHLRRVAALPCLVCARQPSHAHHLTFAQSRGAAMKVSDEFVVPLCAVHHDDLHRAGGEPAWWDAKGIDPLSTAAQLWARRLEIAR